MWTIKTNIIEKDLSYRLVGILFKVHREIGRFCRERQYGDALQQELRNHKIQFQREVPVQIAGRFSNRIDFIIDQKIILDLKAKPLIVLEDYAQIQRYLQITRLQLGMIVNFRSKYLHPRRVLNKAKRLHS